MSASPDLARLLLEKAHGDRLVLLRLIDDEAIPAWSLGFHAQQAVEKALKAMLTCAKVEYPRTHNLSMLLELLRINGLPLPPGAETLSRLTPFGAAFRYEDELEIGAMNILDRAWAMECVVRTVAWAENFLQEK